VKKIYLTGYTPGPYDIFGKLRKDFAKAALGAEKYLEWEKIKNIYALIKCLKGKGTYIISLEQTKSAVNINRFFSKAKKALRKKNGIALVLGNEVRGIPKSILSKSDVVIEIPMRGKKESFNVSVSAGIALYAIRFMF